MIDWWLLIPQYNEYISTNIDKGTTDIHTQSSFII